MSPEAGTIPPGPGELRRPPTRPRDWPVGVLQITLDDRRQALKQFGGGRGIRTPGTLPGTVVFKTTAIDHSAIPPRRDSGLIPRMSREHRTPLPASVTVSVTNGTARDDTGCVVGARIRGFLPCAGTASGEGESGIKRVRAGRTGDFAAGDECLDVADAQRLEVLNQSAMALLEDRQLVQDVLQAIHPPPTWRAPKRATIVSLCTNAPHAASRTRHSNTSNGRMRPAFSVRRYDELLRR